MVIHASADAMDFSKSLASLRHRIHQRKPKGKPMPEAMLRANGRRSKVRSAVEYVFARQKDKMKLFIRTIGISRARGHRLYSLQYALVAKPLYGNGRFRTGAKRPVHKLS